MPARKKGALIAVTVIYSATILKHVCPNVAHVN